MNKNQIKNCLYVLSQASSFDNEDAERLEIIAYEIKNARIKTK